jgi:glycerol kinase
LHRTRSNSSKSTRSQGNSSNPARLRIADQDSRWHEHDPLEIIESIEICIEGAVKSFEEKGYSASSIKAVGITNQRETTVVWDHETGEPLYNAIVWTDARTQGLVRKLKARLGCDRLQELCGLPLSTYPSVGKLLWMIENVPKVSDAYARGQLAFGTVDTWVVYKLNGGPKKKVFVTDPTNASRSSK